LLIYEKRSRDETRRVWGAGGKKRNIVGEKNWALGQRNRKGGRGGGIFMDHKLGGGGDQRTKKMEKKKKNHRENETLGEKHIPGCTGGKIST